MKHLPAIVALAMLIACQATLAQPHRPAGPGGGGGPGRAYEDQRAARDNLRREVPDRRREQGTQEDRGERRMSPDERRELRQQIRDHGRDIYRER